MPSHFHWIVEVNQKHRTISDIMRDIKKYAAWDLMDSLENDGRHDLLKLFEDSARTFPKHQRKFWMSRFEDEVIRNQQMFWGKLNYIHNNPVETGLVGRREITGIPVLATMSSEITRFFPLIRQWLWLRLRHEVARAPPEVQFEVGVFRRPEERMNKLVLMKWHEDFSCLETRNPSPFFLQHCNSMLESVYFVQVSI